jgi:hypothetical protein
LEDTNGSSTLCFESPNNAMENYVNCRVGIILNTQIENPNISLIYPNPVDQLLNIQHYKSINKIEVINVFGQIVLSIPNNSNQVEINLSDLSAGIYLINVYSDNSIGSHRIIKS